MKLLVEADQPGNQLDEYISKLNTILSQKAAGILNLQNRLAHFQQHLNEHNVLVSSLGHWFSFVTVDQSWRLMLWCGHMLCKIYACLLRQPMWDWFRFTTYTAHCCTLKAIRFYQGAWGDVCVPPFCLGEISNSVCLWLLSLSFTLSLLY